VQILTCSTEGCERTVHARGLCGRHYYRLRTYGDPSIQKYVTRGAGHVTSHGYRTFGDGGATYEHRELAERALGRPLPSEVEIHHFDGDGTNNAPGNLVVCPNKQYHKLLHMRQRALEASGDPAKRKCGYCHRWDHVEAMSIVKTRPYAHYHRSCAAARGTTNKVKRGKQCATQF